MGDDEASDTGDENDEAIGQQSGKHASPRSQMWRRGSESERAQGKGGLEGGQICVHSIRHRHLTRKFGYNRTWLQVKK